jgi:hypothetical protein
MVAMEKNVEAIIDDGLLIIDGRIVAGYSAKRESTRVAAVKRAVFLDPGHAFAVREAMDNLKPDSVLILGTSMNMVHRIANALHLDFNAITWISIETVSSEQERDLAQKIRREQGKHVIPAPTMEVRKSFSGYLIDPLRFMFHRKGRSVFVEKSIVRPTYSGLGRFYIADTVISAIVVHAARRHPCVSSVYRVAIHSAPGGLGISLEIGAISRIRLFSMLEDVQNHIRRAIEDMTALNVLVLDIEARHFTLTPSKIQDRLSQERTIRESCDVSSENGGGGQYAAARFGRG